MTWWRPRRSLREEHRAMIDELSHHEAMTILEAGGNARLDCIVDGEPYVAPGHYALVGESAKPSLRAGKNDYRFTSSSGAGARTSVAGGWLRRADRQRTLDPPPRPLDLIGPQVRTDGSVWAVGRQTESGKTSA